MKEPVDHILRPRLPWRDPAAKALTECGLDASAVSTLTRAEYDRRLKDYGQQRTAITTCMTCSNTAHRWRAWDDDPREAVGREVSWESPGYRRSADRGRQLLDELIAMAELVERHRDEFDEIMAVNTRKREWAERKAALEARPKVVIGRSRL